MALLPFKPMPMKVLQRSFVSGIRSQKTRPMLEILEPKVVLFPEDLRRGNKSKFQVHIHSSIPKLKGRVDLEIASNLVTQLSWRKLNHDDMDITRLEGQLFVDHGKHQVPDSSRNKLLPHWGLPDLEKLLTVLSKKW